MCNPKKISHCVIATEEQSLYSYIGSESSTTESIMLHRHVLTVSENGQNHSREVTLKKLIITVAIFLLS